MRSSRRRPRTPACGPSSSETPLGEAEARDARKHADALARQRDALARSIAALLREQDDLLDRMAAELTTR